MSDVTCLSSAIVAAWQISSSQPPNTEKGLTYVCRCACLHVTRWRWISLWLDKIHSAKLHTTTKNTQERLLLKTSAKDSVPFLLTISQTSSGLQCWTDGPGGFWCSLIVFSVKCLSAHTCRTTSLRLNDFTSFSSPVNNIPDAIPGFTFSLDWLRHFTRLLLIGSIIHPFPSAQVCDAPKPLKAALINTLNYEEPLKLV